MMFLGPSKQKLRSLTPLWQSLSPRRRRQLLCLQKESTPFYPRSPYGLAPSAKKVDAFLFKSLGGLMEQFNDCLQPCCSS